MMRCVVEIKWDDMRETVPGFVMIVLMPLMYSIAYGLGEIGSYIVLHVLEWGDESFERFVVMRKFEGNNLIRCPHRRYFLALPLSLPEAIIPKSVFICDVLNGVFIINSRASRSSSSSSSTTMASRSSTVVRRLCPLATAPWQHLCRPKVAPFSLGILANLISHSRPTLYLYLQHWRLLKLRLRSLSLIALAESMKMYIRPLTHLETDTKANAHIV
ncbi:hypothetical protein S245_048889 [Arachis hypogaea]